MGCFRLRASVTAAVTPLITIGQGCAKRGTDARSGMKATELVIFAKGTRDTVKKNESQAIPRTKNATTPFQNREGENAGRNHSGRMNTANAAAVTAATRRWT